MMKSVNESNQQDDNAKAFLPHQLEQDYLSCLLGTDDVDVQETSETSRENLDVATVPIEPADAQRDEKKEVASEYPLENGIADTNENLTESVSEVSADNQGNNTDDEALNNTSSNNKETVEKYLSVEALSVSAPFVCQLMLIAGVRFAVPLANFSRVIAMPENVKVNSNAASACLGKFEWQDKSMFLLALKQIMQPANTTQNNALNETDKIVLVEKDNFGFVCNQMLETVTISPEDVLWRDESSQRYWLAGMVKEAGFAILDVKGILRSATSR